MYSQGLPPRKPARPVQPKADFKFSMLPDEISRRQDISQGGKTLFALILSFSRLKGGSCWLGNDDLAERTGLCVKQVKRLLVGLEGLGLIRRDMIGPRTRHIVVTWGDTMSPHACSGTPEGTFGPRLASHEGTFGDRQEKGEQIKIGIFAPLPEDEPLPPDQLRAMFDAMLPNRRR